MVAIFLALIAGCATTASTAVAAPRSTSSTSARTARTPQALFDPAAHRADNILAEAEQIIRRMMPIRPDAPVSPAKPTATEADSTKATVNGHRVQIYVSLSRASAERIAKRARQLFPKCSVYIVFQAPWHKVRLGNFATRWEAEQVRKRALNRGFRTTIWVPPERE
jgi:hypothetical protein